MELARYNEDAKQTYTPITLSLPLAASSVRMEEMARCVWPRPHEFRDRKRSSNYDNHSNLDGDNNSDEVHHNRTTTLLLEIVTIRITRRLIVLIATIETFAFT